MKSGNLNFLEPSGPLQACNGTASPLPSEQETLDISKDIGLWATSVPKELHIAVNEVTQNTDTSREGRIQP